MIQPANRPVAQPSRARAPQDVGRQAYDVSRACQDASAPCDTLELAGIQRSLEAMSPGARDRMAEEVGSAHGRLSFAESALTTSAASAAIGFATMIATGPLGGVFFSAGLLATALGVFGVIGFGLFATHTRGTLQRALEHVK